MGAVCAVMCYTSQAVEVTLYAYPVNSVDTTLRISSGSDVSLAGQNDPILGKPLSRIDLSRRIREPASDNTGRRDETVQL